MDSGKTSNPKRERSVTPRKRFETLKRDKFTCQYCGAKAPDAILHVDHIVPFSKGGTCDIMNLVTSCADCNNGKSDKRLSDDAVVVKSRKQAELSQHKKQTLGEMAQWQAELASMDEEVAAVNVVLAKANCHLSEIGARDVRRIVKKYGVADLLSALASEIASGYFDKTFTAVEKRLLSAKFQRDDPVKAAAFLSLKKAIKGLPFREYRYRCLKSAADRWVRHSRSSPGWLSGVMEGLAKFANNWDDVDEYIRHIDADMAKGEP